MAWLELVDLAELIQSYSVSLGEAAFRADAATAETHIRQLRLCLLGAIDVYKMLRGGGGGL